MPVIERGESGLNRQDFGLCRVELCESYVRVKKHQLCSLHYSQFYNGKPFAPRLSVWKNEGERCRSEGCRGDAKTLGLCPLHVQQWYRLGYFGIPQRELGINDGECSFTGCQDPCRAKGLCAGHYDQQRSGKVLQPKLSWGKPRGVCAMHSCERTTNANGALCHKHAASKSRHGFQTDDAFIEFWRDAECWICHSRNRLCVDHDHQCCPIGGSCGKCIRGILCTKCNTFLGHYGDRIPLFERAIEYLKRGIQDHG